MHQIEDVVVAGDQIICRNGHRKIEIGLVVGIASKVECDRDGIDSVGDLLNAVAKLYDSVVSYRRVLGPDPGSAEDVLDYFNDRVTN